MPRLRAEEVTFLHLCRKRSRPKGWWPKEIYSLGVTDRRLIIPGPDASDTVKEAVSFFYKGFHEPFYPHILCLTREPLVLILLGIYVAKGHDIPTDEDQQRQRIEGLIRPTWAFVNSSKTYAVPAPGDSRVMWSGLNHKIHDKTKIPKATKLLRTDSFNRLRREDPHCFLTAFGFST